MPWISEQVELPRLAAGVSGKSNPNGKSQGDGAGGVIILSKN